MSYSFDRTLKAGKPSNKRLDFEKIRAAKPLAAMLRGL
jgi:hypothetical protein